MATTSGDKSSNRNTSAHAASLFVDQIDAFSIALRPLCFRKPDLSQISVSIDIRIIYAILIEFFNQFAIAFPWLFSWPR